MTTASSLPAGQRLRDAWGAGPVQIPGVFCPLVARLAETLGFRAVYLSGAALSASLGVPDVGLVSVTEFADEAARIVRATSLPLLCDADTGFGETLNVERTVRLYEAAGAAGLHLEDQVLPKRCGHLSGKALVSTEAMVQKIRAAVGGRRDRSFVIIARTDARGVPGHGMDDALARARCYLDAGADAIFPEALEGIEEFTHFAREIGQGRGPVPLLANMTEFGKSPILDSDELGRLGYCMVLYPVSTLRSALLAARRTLEDILAKGHQRDRVGDMLTRHDLYQLLGYNDYDARDQAYFH